MKAERSATHDDLQEAYGDLEDAKGDVDRWYAKSERTPWLFGNGGKKLPKYSLFGQSHGDLSSAKYRRGEAVSYVGDSKRRIADIKTRRQQSGMRSIGTMPKSARSWRRLAQ
jgi:hypothetical protein